MILVQIKKMVLQYMQNRIEIILRAFQKLYGFWKLEWETRLHVHLESLQGS